jgi:predicted DNA-binding transcriptional regulator YafY
LAEKLNEIFELICRAILGRKQLVCRYDGIHREVNPHIVGYSDGNEMVQVYQFGGNTSRGPIRPPGGYKCWSVSKIQSRELRDGPFHGDEKHKQKQQCVKDIYLHVDLSVPDQPGREGAKKSRALLQRTASRHRRKRS